MLRGNKLRMLRLYRDLSQSQIAKALGVSRNYISMMESEKRDISQEHYDAWIKALNMADMEKVKNAENDMAKGVDEVEREEVEQG